jgi:hypothetical protein
MLDNSAKIRRSRYETCKRGRLFFLRVAGLRIAAVNEVHICFIQFAVLPKKVYSASTKQAPDFKSYITEQPQLPGPRPTLLRWSQYGPDVEYQTGIPATVFASDKLDFVNGLYAELLLVLEKEVRRAQADR